MDIIIFLTLIAVGYFTGSHLEAKHFKSIEDREKQKSYLPVLTISKSKENENAEYSKLVVGSAVISIDYFKRVIAQLINLVGGNVTSYESLVDRARREAVLRMKDQAYGYDYILNLRIETSTVGNSANQKGSVGSVEVLAYGTAVKVSK